MTTLSLQDVFIIAHETRVCQIKISLYKTACDLSTRIFIISAKMCVNQIFKWNAAPKFRASCMSMTKLSALLYSCLGYNWRGWWWQGKKHLLWEGRFSYCLSSSFETPSAKALKRYSWPPKQYCCFPFCFALYINWAARWYNSSKVCPSSG